MNVLSWSRNNATMSAFGKLIPVANDVRNELNKRRKLGLKYEVVMTEPSTGEKPVPYMPRQFPAGTWEITGVTPHNDPKDKYLNPYFIATTARQLVEEWELDDAGGYSKASGRFAMDWGYGIHWPDPKFTTTTLGCIRIINRDDLLFLVSRIQECMKLKQKIIFVVS